MPLSWCLCVCVVGVGVGRKRRQEEKSTPWRSGRKRDLDAHCAKKQLLGSDAPLLGSCKQKEFKREKTLP